MILKNFIEPRLICLNKEGDVRTLGAGNGLSLLLVPRALTRFSRVVMPDNKARTRLAIKMQARQTHHFLEMGMRLVRDRPLNPNRASNPQAVSRTNNKAGLWLWDNDYRAPLRHQLYQPSLLPESLAYEPMDTGVRLVQCIEGVEGQVWQDGILQASRWWAACPDGGEWRLFLRSARIAQTPQNAVPAPIEVPWRRFALPIDFDPDNLRQVFNPGRLAALVGVIALMGSAYQGMRIIGFSSKTALDNSTYTVFLKDNQNAMVERQAALTLLDEIKTHQDHHPSLDVSDVMTDILKNLPVDRISLSDIRINDGEFQVRANFKTDTNNVSDRPSNEANTPTPPTAAIDSVALVNQLESSPYLNTITIEINQARKSITINGKTAPLLTRISANQEG